MRCPSERCIIVALLFLFLWTAPAVCEPPLAPQPVEGGIQFSYRPDGPVRTITLAGEFNDWDVTATPMADEDGDGVWTAVVPLSQGRWEYKFVVDGTQWITDPNAPGIDYGNFDNGIVYVGEEPPEDVSKHRSDVPWSEDDELAPHPVDGGVLFSYRAPKGTASVYLAGEFNGWSTRATPMTDEDDDGLWRTWYPLRAGRSYEYKFVVDGQWVTDPNAPQTDSSNYNNGVVFVAEPGVPYAVMDFPTEESRPQEIEPVSGTLLCYGDQVDPGSIEIRLGEQVLPHTYSERTGRFRAPLPEDLPDLDFHLVVSASSLGSGKRGRTQVDFTMDREPAVFDSPDYFDRTVIYEIFVRSFQDSDGDSVGDLRGVIARLDYLNDGDANSDQDLGVGAIWLMPVCQSPSYHGYDITDYYTIEEDYGTNEDFFALCREAHRRGIRVIFDLVINHCSDQHPFFQDALGNPSSKYSKWFKFLDAGQTEYESFYGYKGMPEFNYDSRALRDWLLRMAKYWMDPNGDGDFSDGVDGYRLDVAKGPPHDWWKELRRELKGVRPDFLLLGEVWDSVETIAGYFDYEFDMQFDYPLYYALLKLMTGGEKVDVRQVLKKEKNKFPLQAQMCRFLDNHDNDRILSALNGSRERNKLAALILLSLPGTPLVYYGEEIGMTGTNPPDEAIRTPMEWGRVLEQKLNPSSLFNWYRQLIHLRSSCPALTARDDQEETSYRELMTDDMDVYAYLRDTSGADPVLVMINLSERPLEDYSIRMNRSLLEPGRYQVHDLLQKSPEEECALLQVRPQGRITSYRPLLQLEPNRGYLLRLHRVQEKQTR
jgi:alpha-amylase